MAYRNYSPSNGCLVDPAGNGDYTTITTAIAGTAANKTIYLMPGTYTENFTLASGKNLSAWICDAFTPNVTIVGTITVSSATTVTLSGIRLQTNSASFLAVTGSAASIVNLKNCYLNCSNNTGITFSSSNSSALINIEYCRGNIGTTGISLFSHSSAGVLSCNWSAIDNSGGSSTASTVSSGNCSILSSSLAFPITTSSTALFSINNSIINNIATNTTCLTTAGTGATYNIGNSRILSGSASAISIGSGTTLALFNSSINSTNTNAITGAGTLNYSGVNFETTGNIINTTTRNPVNYGTWTPTLVGTVTGTTTYTTQQGYYTIVGNIVYVEAIVVITAATGTGNAIFGGLPFTVKNLTSYFPIGNISVSSAAWAWAGTGTQLNFRPQANTTTALVDSLKSTGAAFLQMTNGSATIAFSAWYQI